MFAYESVRLTRPVIKQDVLYTQRHDGVLFHDAKGGMHIQGKTAYTLASKVVPHLRGSIEVGDLCAGLPDTHKEMVGSLVSALYRSGFARDRSTEKDINDDVLGIAYATAFEDQINYIDHYVNEPRRRFSAFRDARFGVLGDGVEAEFVLLGLIRNGASEIWVEDDPDSLSEAVGASLEWRNSQETPVSVSSFEDEDVWTSGAQFFVYTSSVSDERASALRSTRPAGGVVLPSRRHGDLLVVGPLINDDDPFSFDISQRRLESNSTPTPRASGQSAGRPQRAMLGNLLAYEAFKVLTECLAPETRQGVVLQNSKSLDTTWEPVIGGGWPTTRDLGFTSPADQIRQGVPRDQVTEALRTREMLVRPNLGTFQSFHDENLDQSPLKVAAVQFTDPSDGTDCTASGYDLYTTGAARLDALANASEIYARRAGTLVQGAVVFGSEPGIERSMNAIQSYGSGLDVEQSLSKAIGNALEELCLRSMIDQSVVAWEINPSLIKMRTDSRQREVEFLFKSCGLMGISPKVRQIEIDGLPKLRFIGVFDERQPERWTLAFALTSEEAVVNAIGELLHLTQLESTSSYLSDALHRDSSLASLIEPESSTLLKEDSPTWDDVAFELKGAGYSLSVEVVTPPELLPGGIEVAKCTLAN